MFLTTFNYVDLRLYRIKNSCALPEKRVVEYYVRFGELNIRGHILIGGKISKMQYKGKTLSLLDSAINNKQHQRNSMRKISSLNFRRIVVPLSRPQFEKMRECWRCQF